MFVWLPILCIERETDKVEERENECMNEWICYQYHYYFVENACRKQENQPRHAVDGIKAALKQI